MTTVRVVIGAPVFNHEGEFREAIESILSQTYRDFILVIVDDCSSDATEWIARQYVQLDSRVVYVRNDQRLGMIDNWRRAFVLGLEHCPDAEYFAWASDHDIWHPRWLAALVRALDQHPAAVLAYPRFHRVGPNSEVTDGRVWTFNTEGVSDRVGRFRRSLWSMSAGNMIYGLARVADVKACGVFRHVLVPDRLLLMELSLRGEFYQVPEVLWFRRFYSRVFSLKRQRNAFFPNGRPLYALVPWWISHAAVLAWVYAVNNPEHAGVTRLQGAFVATNYFWLSGLLHLKQQIRAVRITVRGKLRTLVKNAVSDRRRQRVISSAARQTRRQTRLLAWRVVQTGAKAARHIPIIGPPIVDRLRPAREEALPGTLDVLHVNRNVARLKRTTRPVIFGPFLAQPEFEILYWLPFLRWLRHETTVDLDLVTAVSRGGVASWYEGLCGRYVDVLNLISLDEVRLRSQVEWRADVAAQKIVLGTLESNIVRRVMRLGAMSKAYVIDPGEMQRLFRHVWMGAAPPELLERHVIRERLAPPPLPPDLKLPSEYVAARFAFGTSFPDTPENRTAVTEYLARLAKDLPVVLLSSDASVDGSKEFDVPSLPGVQRLDCQESAQSILAAQSAVVGRASLVAGTVGAATCLAACYGVPFTAVYTQTPGLTSTTIDGLRRTAAALKTSAHIVRAEDLAGVGASLGVR